MEVLARQWKGRRAENVKAITVSTVVFVSQHGNPGELPVRAGRVPIGTRLEEEATFQEMVSGLESCPHNVGSDIVLARHMKRSLRFEVTRWG